MSDDFNVRKFPEVVEEVKVRRKTVSESTVLSTDGAGDSKPTRVYKIVRTLSSTAIGPSNPARTPGVARSLPITSSGQPPLSEATEDHSQNEN